MRMRRAVHVAVILAGLAACANHKSEAKPATPPPPPSATAPDTKDAKDLPASLEATGLDPSQVVALNRLLDEKPSACGKPHSLRTSIKTDPACKRSVIGGRY